MVGAACGFQFQGIEDTDEKTRLPDGRPAEFANRDASDYSGFNDALLGDEERVVVPPYEWPYETLVLKRVLGKRRAEQKAKKPH